MICRKILLGFLAAVLLVGTVLGAIAACDYYLYPNYHSIKLGMTKKEVDLIICCSGSDDYPNNAGGCTSYYFAREGTIIVVFDRNRITVLKKKISFQ